MIFKLIQKQVPKFSLDASELVAACFRDEPPERIESLVLGTGHRWSIGDYFRVEVVDCDERGRSPRVSHSASGDSRVYSPDTSQRLVFIQGDLAKFDRIGYRISDGTVVIHGDVGDGCGAEMSGGELIVVGNVGDDAAVAMSGGVFGVSGNVGDRLARPLPGKLTGMRGGDILIGGSVGHQPMERMRRGTVFIRRDAGSHGCANMIAGTVIGLGEIGSRWCVGMRRGTVVLSKSPSDWDGGRLSTPRYFEMSFLPLIWKHLARTCNILEDRIRMVGGSELGILSSLPTSRWVDRQVGDLDRNGVGEVLVLQRIRSSSSH